MIKQLLKIGLLALIPASLFSQDVPAIVKKAAYIQPSPRQVAWQELEFTCFYHFGINTFTNREWGLPNQDPGLFNPSSLDAAQWIRAAKGAGAKGVVVVAKHHDGFCNWPSKYTDYSVKKSPWKKGQGDVIAEVAKACRELGIKFGFYLSPWDISSPLYGTEEYNVYFKNQLRELLTNYGDVAEVWFDGACGEGPNGKKQVYDWPGYYKLVRQLQPNAVIAVMGPDVRWVGTESGYGRETEWSVVPVGEATQQQIAESSQQNPGNGTFKPPDDMYREDLGSRGQIITADTLVWFPSEVDVSIRPGWFYHKNEDSLVKSPENLVDIYFSSIGRNSVLLLNLPPDTRGLIPENDVKSLQGMRNILEVTFQVNLAENGDVTASPENPAFDPRNILDWDNKTYWTPGPGVFTCMLEIDLKEIKTFDRLLLQENFRNGQRVESFIMEALIDNEWKEITKGTTIGYKRLLRFSPVKAQKVRLTILSSRENPEIASFGLFKSPD
ncbi:MAG: alpha-L-fucosidase [Bacteroidetes bacterium]|nr:alpha-L-fucosidase [Bacteroidota bacterium]